MANRLVVKSNDLIQARYSLSLNEQKIILYAVSKLDKEKNKFNILELEARDFIELLGTTVFRYTEIREVVTGLMSKQVRIETDKRELVANWISSIDYIKDSGIIELEFSEKLIPYLLQLKKRFTRYQLKNILYLKNKHSIRIYELMKQYEVIGKREFTLEELKDILMLDGKYTDFKNFNRFILKQTMEEINEQTDLLIDYKKVTKGRKVVAVEYTISSKENKEYINYLNENYDIKEFKRKSGLENENFDANQIIELYTIGVEKIGDNEDINMFDYIRLNYIHMLENKTVRNKYSYLKKALKEDYAIAIGQLRLKFSV